MAKEVIIWQFQEILIRNNNVTITQTKIIRTIRPTKQTTTTTQTNVTLIIRLTNQATVITLAVAVKNKENSYHDSKC